MIMTSAHFRTQTGVQIKSAFLRGKSSAELITIHNDLSDFEQGNYPKYDPTARWQFMMTLAGKCIDYIVAKEAKGRNLNKPKHRCIDALASQLMAQMSKEMTKAQMYGNKVTQYDRVTSALPMGRNNPGHGKVKFELALGGKGGPVVNGQSLWHEASKAGLALTGNDSQDAYVLRSWLKHLARQNQLKKYCFKPIEYADAQQRQAYLLTFSQATCSQGGKPFDTTGGFTPGENCAGPFVISDDGEWYAKAGKFTNNAGFHHSSFLSGAPVMLAGTIRSANGTLQYISNSSGHYAPKISDLVNGAAQIATCGLDFAATRKISILAYDHDDIYKGGKAQGYLFPYSDFVRTHGAVPNPTNYAVFSLFDELYWTNPTASRPGHPATMGPSQVKQNKTMFPVAFPT